MNPELQLDLGLTMWIGLAEEIHRRQDLKEQIIENIFKYLELFINNTSILLKSKALLVFKF